MQDKYLELDTQKELVERLRKQIELTVYDKNSMALMEIPDQLSNWWIFNFKSFFFEKENALLIAKLFWLSVNKLFPDNVEIAIGGMESGAIPLVSALTLFAPLDRNVSGFFIRKSRKKADLANIVEGEISANAKVIIVDDLLNNGSSIQKIKEILKTYNKEASLYFSIICYRDRSFYENIIGTPILSLYDLNDFRTTLGLRNLENRINKPVVTFENRWAIRLSKPNPYYVCPKSAPCIYEKIIYQGSDDGNFFAISSETGEVIWKYQVSFGAEGKRIFSSPVVSCGLVIFGAYDGSLYALNCLTGKKEWVFFDGDAIGSSPTVSEDLQMVYIGLEFGLFNKRGGVAAINVKTGKTIWTNYQMDGLTHASPSYSVKNKVVVCGCNDNKIYCFDAKNGKIIWTFLTGGEVKYGSFIDEENNLVYIASMDGNVYSLRLKDGSLVRKFETTAAIYSNPVLYKGKLIIGSLDKKIYCWDINKGELIWCLRTNGRIFASPVIHNDLLYIGSNDGVLRVIAPQNGKLFGSIVLPERIVNKILIEDNLLYVPTHACELLAFSEKIELS
jgi:outer membrane protein assembly factor BamB